MGDLAARLGISKKTLYEQVHSKDELVSQVTEHYFVAVARDQVALRANNTIPPLEKVELILCVVPQLPFRTVLGDVPVQLRWARQKTLPSA